MNVCFVLSETKYTIQDVSWSRNLEAPWSYDEGTSQVKESKISVLAFQYEAFKMEEGETINTMYNRFNNIIVGLQNLCKKLKVDVFNMKLLASLPIEWRCEVTAIEETNNLKAINIEKLGSLITHEHTLKRWRIWLLKYLWIARKKVIWPYYEGIH